MSKKRAVGHASRMKTNIRRVFWLYFGLFALLVAYLVKFVLTDSKAIVENPANPHIDLIAGEVVRGSISDARGELLAYSRTTNGGFVREYPYGQDFAHLVGFADLGQSGVESKYNFVLQKLHFEVFQRINQLMTDEPLTGNGLVLTADAGLQQLAAQGLGKQKGAVVVMEPSTGKILAMVSYPGFNPNNLAANWDALTTNDTDSPLLNRATQGLYPPGSVYKIVSAAAAYENLTDYGAFTYDCAGEATFGEKRIRCFNEKVHGHVDVSEGFAQSCNTLFSAAGLQVGPEKLRAVSERLFFNQSYPCPLPYSRSSFPLEANATETEIVETSIGQGRTLVTPLHMAMITCAVANGGLMMEPYVVDRIVDKNGKPLTKNLPKPLGQVMPLEEAEAIKNMMVAVVDHGTGQNAALSGVAVAGKTGTAENASGDDHGWFVAFAPADKPEVAVAIVLENSGGPRKAIPLAAELMDYVLQGKE